MAHERLPQHMKNNELETLLFKINDLLASPERYQVANYEFTKYPVILLFGPPRCGSTIFMQWLANTNLVSYPTNLLSRFYGAPYIGSLIQLILTKHDFNGEIFDFVDEVPFVSRLGKTRGVLAPNEFWYFWRRFFKFREIQKLTDDELKLVDFKTFVSEIAAIEHVFDKPFATKGMILNWNIPFLAQILDKVLFVHITRDPVYNIQSLLKARLDYFGDMKAWYSFKPPEYYELVELDPYMQVAGQIYYTNKSVEDGLCCVPSHKKLSIKYEEFCVNPKYAFSQITQKLKQQGYDSNLKYRGPKSFEIGNKSSFSVDEMLLIEAAYQSISKDNVHI